MYLGTLGNLASYRCRDCGHVYQFTVEQELEKATDIGVTDVDDDEFNMNAIWDAFEKGD